MENKARYILVGAFAIAVLAAGFAFTYWLNTAGGLQQRAYYRILYRGSVAGLLVGSAVQFNGVRVGDVSALDLDPSSPDKVMVTVAVAPETPIRTDTKAGITFQGLMGSPAVSLTGGPTSGQPPTPSEGMPALIANPKAGETMADVALSALHRIDTVVSENAEPLRNTMGNLSKFSNALARNSERVDGIVAGIERMTGGGAKSQNAVFDLTAATTFPAFEKASFELLFVQYPTAPNTLGQDKILIRGDDGLRPISPDAKWNDMLLDQVQSKIVQSFENAGFLKHVARPIEGANADFQLITDIRDFQIVSAAQPSAEVEYTAKILNSDGRIVGARLFKASRAAKSIDAPDVVAALDAAFLQTLPDLIVWTSSTIRDASGSR
jgi:phospholipid/cholesterol/gamma-HCH transport system substrate-binding protein